MAAYVIADITVTDAELYPSYTAITPGTIEKYGGRFVIRGGAHETVEGDWQPGRLVMLEFDDMAAARRWYDSPEYTEARAIRQRAATGSLAKFPLTKRVPIAKCSFSRYPRATKPSRSPTTRGVGPQDVVSAPMLTGWP